jgi:hypothetical protein
MPDSNKSFLNVFVIVLLGALFATFSTIAESWKNRDVTGSVSNQVSTVILSEQ